uniref:Exosome complex component RRP45 n=1 Tax=Timema monikensis TaxID=170555 RepID=A0A7R9EE53_9NEOP|nr:unnamed protein product [Timema monikensis]
MKEALLSNCERTFVLQALSEGKRIDGREIDEFREMEIFFGTDWGCCQVSLGDTKYVRTDLELSPMETPSMDVTDISQITRLFSSLRVLAQVSCDVMAPKATRPNEGLLHINVELSPMGAPHFESGRLSELGVQLNRLLEKAIKDSHCVDLESLCIVAEEKVFNLRVDVHILNHEGNLVEAASIAALTALSHFRRPDVTMTGEKTIIHDPSERDPIPVVLHHHPVCVSYALFNKGTVVVADPTALEERVSEAQIVFGMNAYRELCGLHLGGSALATFETVVNCAIRAGNRAAQVVQKIKTLLAQDAETRAAGKPVGFTDCIRQPNVLAMSQDRLAIRLHRRDLRETARNLVSVRTGRVERSNMLSTDEDEDEPTLLSLGNGSAELVPSRGKSGKYPLGELGDTPVGLGGPNKWEQHNSSSSDSDDAEEEDSKDLADNTEKKVFLPMEGIDDEDGDDEGDDDDDFESGDSDIEVIQEISIEDKKKPLANIELSDSEEEEKGTLYPGDLEPSGGREQQMSDMASNKNQASESDDSTTTRSWYPKKTPW